MAQLDTLETKLDDLLRKKAPVQVPPEGRSWIARNAWWLSLVAGLCLLWSSLVLWQAGHTVDRFAQMYQSFTGEPYVHRLGISYYLSLLATAGTGVLMLLATANLKDMRRSGWNYLFYASLLQAVASVFLLFSDFGGFARFVGSLISAGVGAYFLFQIRDFFTEKGIAHTTGASETSIQTQPHEGAHHAIKLKPANEDTLGATPKKHASKPKIDDSDEEAGK